MMRGGRGGGGRGGRGARGGLHCERPLRDEQFKPHLLYPEGVNLPSVPTVDSIPKEERTQFLGQYNKFEKFWKDSGYYVQEEVKESSNAAIDAEIERYSDKSKQKGKTMREPLESYLKLTISNFPAELLEGNGQTKKRESKKSKVEYASDVAAKRLEMCEKLEEKFKGQDEKEVKEKKGEGEDDEDIQEEVAEEESSDDDYNQNIDFDDDEDDLNMEEEKEEDCYE